MSHSHTTVRSQSRHRKQHYLTSASMYIVHPEMQTVQLTGRANIPRMCATADITATEITGPLSRIHGGLSWLRGRAIASNCARLSRLSGRADVRRVYAVTTTGRARTRLLARLTSARDRRQSSGLSPTAGERVISATPAITQRWTRWGLAQKSPKMPPVSLKDDGR